MAQLLQLFIWLPLIGFFASLLVPRKKERPISGIAIATVGLHLLGILIFIGLWIADGLQILDIKHIVLYKTSSFEFFIDFYFDITTAVYAFTGSTITLLVAIFSRFYIHREAGFKRYFATLLLFFLGYNLVIFSGNFETLFIGWEILGICSFLLIAFYRDRYLPVKNALKVISVYRLGDVCLMLAMWMCHHLFHENITFPKTKRCILYQQSSNRPCPTVYFYRNHVNGSCCGEVRLIAFLILASQGHGRTHHLQRGFLWFIIGTPWRFSFIENLSILGRTASHQNKCYCIRITYQLSCNKYRTGSINCKNTNCIFLHRANRFDIYRSGIGFSYSRARAFYG